MKAQPGIISIEQASDYINTRDSLPAGITIVRDINNSLNKYVGTWTGLFEGKKYDFRFTKEINHDYGDGMWDRLIGRFVIVNGNGYGVVEYNSLGQSIQNISLWGGYYQKNGQSYKMSFVGNCYNDAGTVYLTVKSSQPDTMYLSYWVNPDLQSSDCPPNTPTILPLSPKVLTLIKEPPMPGYGTKAPKQKILIQKKKGK